MAKFAWMLVFGLAACGSKQQVEPSPREQPVEHERVHRCDPMVPCESPVLVGQRCGDLDAGCGKTVPCRCDDELQCVEGICLTAEGKSYVTWTPKDIAQSFEVCEGTARVGQIGEMHGANCDEVCSAFGFQRCLERRDQTGFVHCSGEETAENGCEVRNDYGWMSECVCGTGE